MKKYNKKSKVLVLVLLILGISIGFAALSTTLKITGSAILHNGKWNIYWDNVEVTSGSVSAEDPVIDQDQGEQLKTKVTWEVELEEPGDFYEFTVDAVNAGSYDAIITDIESTVTPELPTFINYTVTYADNTAISMYDPLNKADDSTTPATPTRKKYKVRVAFSSEVTEEQLATIPENGYEFEFEYDVTYGQASINDPNREILVTLKTEDGTSVSELDPEEMKKKIGDDIKGFNPQYPGEWQLFYADEDYIYLITKNYVAHKYLPSELYKSGYNAYNIGFTSDDYSVNNILTDSRWSSGMASDAIQNNPITTRYLKYAATYPTDNNNNAIATAYMMDTDVWKNFAGNVKDSFAMGGPTLEMVLASFNAGNIMQYESYEAVNSENSTNIGYKIKKVNERSYTYNWNDSSSQMAFYPYWTKTPNVWDPSVQSNPVTGYVNSYFIASPSSYNANSLPIFGYGGELYINNSQAIPTSNSGMRPVVAIPRTSLK